MIREAVASSPAKVILFGEHGVHRGQRSITTTVDLRTSCRVSLRDDTGYSFTSSGGRYEKGTLDDLRDLNAHVDVLRGANAVDEIAALAYEFFVPARYVLATLLERVEAPGLDVEWRSALPIGSGLGSGAAANTSFVVAAACAYGLDLDDDDVIHLAWQGDVIAHGGYGSSLDSSTCTYGGLISYTVAHGAERLPFDASLPLVIGDTRIAHSTSVVNTHIRSWLEEMPSRARLFDDMGYLIDACIDALEREDLQALGHLMNLHQLLQEKMGTSCSGSERLIEAAIAAGALGAKISGSGGGGIIIALAAPGDEPRIAAAIDAAGGTSYVVRTGAEPARLEAVDAWAALVG